MDPATLANTRVIELDIQGMTCASCVARVERKLGKLDGVQAVVNLPLESARVTLPGSVTDQQILDTVTATGYSARVKTAPTTRDPDNRGTEPKAVELSADEPATAAALRPRLLLAAAFTLPVLIMSMVPAGGQKLIAIDK